MSLASGARLATDFQAWELGADKPAIPDWALANVRDQLAPWLQAARDVLGVPIIVNRLPGDRRGWRDDAENAAVGGSATSDHPNGLAGDWDTELKALAVYTELKAARSTGALPPFDQLIYYPVDGHWHVGLGPRMRGEFRIALAEGGYPFLTADTLQQLGKAAVPVLAVLLVALLLALVIEGNSI